MTWLEIIISLYALCGIGFLFWCFTKLGPPHWTHYCERKGGAPVDIPEGRGCPWCGSNGGGAE